MTNQEAIENLKALQGLAEWVFPMDFAAALDVAIEALQNFPTEMSGSSQPAESTRILADILDGCPLTNPCDKLWSPEGWCKNHCKDGQGCPAAECWIKYTEVVINERSSQPPGGTRYPG